MNLSKKQLAAFHITCRVLIALIGGYLVSMNSAILIGNHLFSNQVNSIVTGLMLSFIIYLIIVLYVFATNTTLRACLSVFGLCLVLHCLNDYLPGSVLS